MLQRVLCSLSLLTLAISTAHAAEALDTPRLAGMDNFRDIAGTTSAYTTSHDGTMRAGVFYRSMPLPRPPPTWLPSMAWVSAMCTTCAPQAK